MRVKQTVRGGDRNYDLTNIMKLVIAVVFSLTVALLNATQQPPLTPQDLAISETAQAKPVEKQESKPAEVKPPEQPAVPQPPAFDANNPATWPKCAEGQIVRADNGQCADAPKPAPSSGIGMANSASGGSGDCAAEIAKYNWNYNVALAVARAESGLNPGSLNDNPATGDYSVGCFQVNLYGANARTRPSEAQLKNAAVNVQWAYNNYVANGHSFIGQWGVCGSKVSCY